jgi:hypothetical protein
MPTNILQNKFGGVDQRSLPQKGEDFLEINGVFPRFAGLQNRIEGKLLKDKFANELLGIFQAWNPFGYGLGVYQTNNNLLTDTWYPPDFPLPAAISYLIPTDNGLSNGGGGLPNYPPLPSNPPTILQNPQTYCNLYTTTYGHILGVYGASFPGIPPADYGNADLNQALKVYPVDDIPYIPENPVNGSPSSLDAYETKTSNTGWLGGWYPVATIESTGSYVSGRLDLHAYLPLRAAVLMGQKTILKTDGTTVVIPAAYCLQVDQATGLADFTIMATIQGYHINIDYVSVAPSSQGYISGHMEVKYTSLQIYH